MSDYVDAVDAGGAEADAPVAIVGAGPAGMMLAAELTLAGVDVALLERRADQKLAGSRAGGFHSRTIELFDQRGIADRECVYHQSTEGDEHRNANKGSAQHGLFSASKTRQIELAELPQGSNRQLRTPGSVWSRRGI